MNNNLGSINDTLFITNEMNQQKEIYRWSPPKDLVTKFGVEFECCVKINPDCIKFNTNLLNVLPKSFTFKEKFDLYYKHIITKSPEFSKLAEEYGYLLVIDSEKTDSNEFYYDMSNPELPGMDASELLKMEYAKDGINQSDIYHRYYDYPAERVKRVVNKGFNYEIPMFVDDRSIRCGDSRTMSEKERASVFDVNSFRFECITPILSIKGYPTKERIKKEMYPLLSLFGLDKPNCFVLNFSMGFHVNVSLYNERQMKYVAIAEPPFLNQLLRNYIKVERRVYSNVRRRKPIDAENGEYVTEFAKPLYKNLNRLRIENPELSENQIINTRMINRNYMNDKYKGLKRKSPFLLEFRLFEGDSDIDRLTNHVFVALDVLHKTANEVAKTRRLPLVENRPNSNSNNNNNNEINLNRLNYGGYRRTIKRKRNNRRKTNKNK